MIVFRYSGLLVTWLIGVSSAGGQVTPAMKLLPTLDFGVTAGLGNSIRATGLSTPLMDSQYTFDWLVRRGIGARGHLGSMGGSYGGYATMVGVTEFPNTFAAAANLFGMVNFETFFAQSTPWMGAISTGEYGDLKTQRQLLRDLSPIHKLDRVRTPLLVLHGANDTNVPLVEAEQIVETLKKRDVTVEYVLFPDEGHGWRKEANRVRSTLEMATFFRRHLQTGNENRD